MRLVPGQLAGLLLLIAAAHPAGAQSAAACEQAGRDAEQYYALPSGLLQAVGRVETGRWNAALGRVAAWPWAVDAGGDGRLLDNKPQAIATVRDLQASGHRNIDVGCFQINLAYHPNAFASLEQAFDPQANALYAAHLLESLHSQFGNWQDAVAAYHSATPAFGLPYRDKVYAAWSGTTWPAAGGMQVAAFGIRIWTPAARNDAPRTIVISTQLTPGLPRVVTP